MFPPAFENPREVTPWANRALAIGLIGLHLAATLWPGLREALALSPATPIVANYLTASLIPAGTAHLLLNLPFLYLLGGAVNARLGQATYLALYLVGGVVGWIACVPSAVSRGVSDPLLGTDGTIAAIAGAYFVLFPRSMLALGPFGPAHLRGTWLVAAFVLKDFILPFTGPPAGAAHVAHLSGGVIGFATCYALLALNLLPRGQFDLVALAKRWRLRHQYRGLVRQGFDPFGASEPQTPPPSRESPRLEAPPDPLLQRIQDLRAEISESLAHHNHPHAALLYQELLALDGQQILSRPAQLEVATQLASQQRYAEAAHAYEQFVLHYGNFEQIEQVELMLGLVYARYLDRPDRAREYLLRAMARLHTEREIHMAQAELNRLEVKHTSDAS